MTDKVHSKGHLGPCGAGGLGSQLLAACAVTAVPGREQDLPTAAGPQWAAAGGVVQMEAPTQEAGVWPGLSCHSPYEAVS